MLEFWYNIRVKKIVLIGGGSGLSIMCSSLKNIKDIEISAIVTVADDGGSTGRLRRDYNIPAVGDIRNVMLALSDEDNLLKKVMSYRFDGENELSGHQMGNLIFASLLNSSNDFLTTIKLLSSELKIKANVIPSTTQIVSLYALMDDDTIVKGESNIPTCEQKIKKLFYNQYVLANSQAVEKILEADYVIYSIGSLYTSVIANIIIPRINQALIKTKAKIIYCANVMTQNRETLNMSLEEHVTALENHGMRKLDYVIVSNTPINQALLDKYLIEESKMVEIKDTKHDYQLIYADLLEKRDDLIRHDAYKLQKVIEELIQ